LYGGIKCRHYSVGLKNASKTKSIDDICLRALESHFVLCAISPERMPLHKIVDRNPTILKLDTLAPDAAQFAEMFSIGGTDIWGEQDILSKKHAFTLEAHARDTQKATITLEYDPSTKPPTVRRIDSGSRFVPIYEAARIAFEAAEDLGILDLVSSAHAEPPNKLTIFWMHF
jgi:hypothetical protein